MTVVDSSAFMALLMQERDAEHFAVALAEMAPLNVCAATVVELGAVCLRRGGEPLLHELRGLTSAADIDIVPLTAELAWASVDAYRRFGRGIGEPACLNFGDCFSYALAKLRDEPLLYKGNDFSQTDIRSAL